MYTLPKYWTPPTVGVDPEDLGSAARAAQEARMKAVWDAAQVAFVGAVGAVVGGVVMPQLAGEYFDWMGGAVVGGLIFAGVTAYAFK